MPGIVVMPGIVSRDRTGLEVWGVRDMSTRADGTTECEQVDPDDDRTPDFYSIYEHEPSGECMVVEDYGTRRFALQDAQRIASRRGLTVYDFTREGYRG